MYRLIKHTVYYGGLETDVKSVMDWEKYLDEDTDVIHIIPESSEFSVEELKPLMEKGVVKRITDDLKLVDPENFEEEFKRGEHFRVIIRDDINVTFDKNYITVENLKKKPLIVP